MAKTGFMAQFDKSALIGAELAAEDINSEGGIDGRPLEVVQVDSKSDKTQAAQAATQLISEDGADALLVSCDFDYGGPAAIVAQSSEKLAFGCAASPRFGVQGIGNNAFTLDTYTQGEGAAAAEWAFNNKKWKSVYILTDESIDYTKTLSEFFKQRWTELAGADAILGEDTFNAEDTSISAQVTRINSLAKQPDFIFLPSCPPGTPTGVRSIRSAGIDTPILAGVCTDGDFWLKGMSDLSDYYYLPWVSTYGDDPEPEVNEFVERLKQAGGSDQFQFGVVGYSMVQSYAKAVEKAGTEDTEAVRTELESFKEEPLLIGPTTFTAELHGDPGRPFAAMEIQNGTHKYLEDVTPEKPPASGL
jgi:branched-chain amino acid transport system substrate-binding protein